MKEAVVAAVFMFELSLFQILRPRNDIPVSHLRYSVIVIYLGYRWEGTISYCCYLKLPRSNVLVLSNLQSSFQGFTQETIPQCNHSQTVVV